MTARATVFGIAVLSGFLAGCGTVAKYHSERSAPVPTGKFGYEPICEIVLREQARRSNPRIDPDQIDLSGKLGSCIKADAKSDERIQVARQDKMFDFIYKVLPTSWFGTEPERRNPLYQPHVQVTARSPLAPKEPSKNFLTGMSDRGQQAVVEFLSSKDDVAKAAEGLLGALGKSGAQKSTDNPFETRRIIPLLISTSFDSNNPADRLEKVYIFIRPLEKEVTIVDVERPVLETLQDKVNLGTEKTGVEVSPTLNIEGLALGGGATGKPGATGKFTQSLEKTLSKRFALRSVSLSPDRSVLFVRQEGQEGIDISGNVLASVTLDIPVQPTVLEFFSVEQVEPKKKWTTPRSQLR